ncbi:DNA-binding protein, histone-like, putative [Saccharicrinis carchari]|uniref:DNA-binding protein, histone-like, putative n=1 Tax=Saccharicrinis carchari TaxID=1168039 RepID=A0A521CRI8_SACCC|nr:HU family DNA-binding protein [Saccharicrinis carchari]SMO62089.1 DNA-binding protein, histone-like, putative [Saccharicrinis carchari]
MPIKFNVIERGQPGVVGGGEKKFYASAKMEGDLTLEGLTNRIEKISTVSGADIRAVLYAMVDVMVDSLGDGKNVRLGDLGSLRVGISSVGEATAAEVKASSVKSSKVIFTPGKKIKEMLNNLIHVKA